MGPIACEVSVLARALQIENPARPYGQCLALARRQLQQQPALPGAEHVRAQEVPHPAFALPKADPNDFSLTNPAGAPIDAPSLFDQE